MSSVVTCRVKQNLNECEKHPATFFSHFANFLKISPRHSMTQLLNWILSMKILTKIPHSSCNCWGTTSLYGLQIHRLTVRTQLRVVTTNQATEKKQQKPQQPSPFKLMKKKPLLLIDKNNNNNNKQQQINSLFNFFFLLVFRLFFFLWIFGHSKYSQNSTPSTLNLKKKQAKKNHRWLSREQKYCHPRSTMFVYSFVRCNYVIPFSFFVNLFAGWR